VLVWLQFIACAAAIVYSGSRLSRYGDIIAEKTGLGRLWVGALLVAMVTSLPELISGVSAVTVFDLPEIAVGGVIGSCMFNVLIISLVDALTGRKSMHGELNEGHVLSAGFGVLLLGLITLNLCVGAALPSLGWVGVSSVVFILLYVLAMRVIFLYNKRKIAARIRELAREYRYKEYSLRRAVLLYALNAAVIVAAAAYLPELGARIAAITGMTQTFVGNFFIALATSLPEVVVTVAAVRMGAVDLALGDLFGSNLFNVAILAIDDFAYTKGPILAEVSGHHVVIAAAAIAMTATAIIGLTYRQIKKSIFLAWDSIGILAIYIVGQAILFMLGR
jgi:cation:H+ antiporter